MGVILLLYPRRSATCSSRVSSPAQLKIDTRADNGAFDGTLSQTNVIGAEP